MKNATDKRIRANLRKVIKKGHASIETFAVKNKIAPAYLYSFLNGHRDISLGTLLGYCDRLKIDLKDLLK